MLSTRTSMAPTITYYLDRTRLERVGWPGLEADSGRLYHYKLDTGSRDDSGHRAAPRQRGVGEAAGEVGVIFGEVVGFFGVGGQVV